MASSTLISDSAPFSKKTKKNKKRQEAKEKEEERGDMKKIKKRRHKQRKSEERTDGGGEKRKQGGEEEKKQRKRRKKEESQTQAEQTQAEQTQAEQTRAEETREGSKTTRKKKERKQTTNKESQTRVNMKEEDFFNLSDAGIQIEFTGEDLLVLEEFIPDIQRRSLCVKQKHIRYDLPRFREFKQRGLKLRWGKYSEDENSRIRENVENLLKLTNIETSEELFFPQRFPEKERSIRNLRGIHGFYWKLADGLLRTCEQVYVRGKKMYDQRNHMGRFSEEELQTMQKLHTIHGNNWKLIGNQLERSVYSCQKRHARSASDHGPWTHEELSRLKKAAKKHLKRVLKSRPVPASGPASDPASGPTFVQLCSRLPWKQISAKVQTRSWAQCRLKWFTYLKTRLKAAEPKTLNETLQTRVRLIQTLFELQVEDVCDVDWIQVAQSVGGVTPICVQKLFHRLKLSLIPEWTRYSFGEMVDVLFEKELPQIQMKLQKRLGSGPGSISGPGSGPERFSLEQLFPPEREEFREVDNS